MKKIITSLYILVIVLAFLAGYFGKNYQIEKSKNITISVKLDRQQVYDQLYKLFEQCQIEPELASSANLIGVMAIPAEYYKLMINHFENLKKQYIKNNELSTIQR